MTKAPLIKSEEPSATFERVIAVIVGIEKYQGRKCGGLPEVEYAQDDATEFANVLRNIYDPGCVDIRLLFDHDATCTSLHNESSYLIHNLEENELFVFCNAGHGFCGVGGKASEPDQDK